MHLNCLHLISVLTTFPGGLAGCVIAGRLAEADPSLSILVIEQGPNNYEEPQVVESKAYTSRHIHAYFSSPQVVHPALYPRNLFASSNFTLFWQGNKSPQLANRSPIVRPHPGAFLIPISNIQPHASPASTLVVSLH